MKGKEICQANCDIILAITWRVAEMQNKFAVRIPHEMLLFLTLPTKAEEKVIKRNISEFLARVLREGRGQSAAQSG